MYQVFEIQCVFYTYSTSHFRLATFHVLNSKYILLVWLLAQLYIKVLSAENQCICSSRFQSSHFYITIIHSGGFMGESIFFLFTTFRSCPYSLAHVSLHLQSQQRSVESFSHHITPTLTLLPPSSTFKEPCDYTGSTG